MFNLAYPFYFAQLDDSNKPVIEEVADTPYTLDIPEGMSVPPCLIRCTLTNSEIKKLVKIRSDLDNKATLILDGNKFPGFFEQIKDYLAFEFCFFPSTGDIGEFTLKLNESHDEDPYPNAFLSLLEGCYEINLLSTDPQAKDLSACFPATHYEFAHLAEGQRRFVRRANVGLIATELVHGLDETIEKLKWNLYMWIKGRGKIPHKIIYTESLKSSSSLQDSAHRIGESVANKIAERMSTWCNNGQIKSTLEYSLCIRAYCDLLSLVDFSSVSNLNKYHISRIRWLPQFLEDNGFNPSSLTDGSNSDSDKKDLWGKLLTIIKSEVDKCKPYKNTLSNYYIDFDLLEKWYEDNSRQYEFSNDQDRKKASEALYQLYEICYEWAYNENLRKEMMHERDHTRIKVNEIINIDSPGELFQKASQLITV